MSSNQIALLYVPVPDAATGERLAGELLEAGRIACANLHGPMKSIYRWEGKVCHEEEYAVLLKAPVGMADAVARWIEEAHPYECPCVLRGDATANPAFAEWVASL